MEHPKFISRRLSSLCDDKERFIVIGLIEDKHWSAIVTYRNESIRLISVRRSRKQEVLLYES